MMRQVIPVALAYQDDQNAAILQDYAAILADLGHERLAPHMMGSGDGWHAARDCRPPTPRLNEIAGAIDGARTRLPPG